MCANNIIKFDRAYETVLNSARPLGTEQVGLDRALGRVLAQDVVSDIDMPPFNKAAMDGFACRRADLANELEVIETIPAGTIPAKSIGPNQCAKIMTGAMVPDGADCVIMVEFTKNLSENTIRFTGKNTADNICLKAEDVKVGGRLLRKGTVIAPQHIAVLAVVGCVKPLVASQPKVGIIATGNELVDPVAKPAPSQIRNSNSFQLCAQVQSLAAIPTNYGIANDTAAAIDSMLKKALSENDVVIISGGVSMGDFDLVPEILRKNNIELLFEKVAIKPGKPTLFGIIENRESRVENKKFVFGLPGNPVSAFVIFEVLVKPFLYKLMSCDFRPPLLGLPLGKTIKRKKADRDFWLPVVCTDKGTVAPLEYHGSAHISAICQADGLICIPAGTAELKEATTVYVRRI